MEQIISLVIPFILLIIFGQMTDRLTVFLEELMNPIPWLPDKIESKLAFLILAGIGFVICWEFQFNLFGYLNHPGRHDYIGYLGTALILAGGSSFIKQSFDTMNGIPSIFAGLTTTMFRMMGKGEDRNNK